MYQYLCEKHLWIISFSPHTMVWDMNDYIHFTDKFPETSTNNLEGEKKVLIR